MNRNEPREIPNWRKSVRDLEAEAFDQMGIQDLGQKILTKQKQKIQRDRTKLKESEGVRERGFLYLCVYV